jgi:hypothetical protein
MLVEKLIGTTHHYIKIKVIMIFNTFKYASVRLQHIIYAAELAITIVLRNISNWLITKT